jgi:hypothetical protein
MGLGEILGVKSLAMVFGPNIGYTVVTKIYRMSLKIDTSGYFDVYLVGLILRIFKALVLDINLLKL